MTLLPVPSHMSVPYPDHSHSNTDFAGVTPTLGPREYEGVAIELTLSGPHIPTRSIH
ncbi:hypothetical protein BD626DRAFT_516811, partial [Schizophyllum amplum]